MSMKMTTQTGLTLGTRRGFAPLPEIIAVVAEVEHATFKKREKLSPAQRFTNFLNWEERLKVRNSVHKKWKIWHDIANMQEQYLASLDEERRTSRRQEYLQKLGRYFPGYVDISADVDLMNCQGLTAARIASTLFKGVLWVEQGDRELIISYCERLVMLGYQLYRSQSLTDVMVALGQYISGFIDGSMAVWAMGGLSMFVGEVFCDESDFSSLSFQGPNGGPSFDGPKEFIANYERFKDSTVWKKLYRLMAYACSLSLFSKVGLEVDPKTYGVFEKQLMELNLFNGSDFIMTLLDTCVYISEIGYQCFKTGSISPMLMKGRDYETWVTEAMELKQVAPNIASIEALGYERFDVIQRLNDAIDAGDAMMRWFKPDQVVEKRYVGNLLNDLKLIKNTVLTRDFASKERPAPFACLLYGGTSVGKSTFQQLLFLYFGKLFNLKTDDHFKYPRNPANKYWDNFNTAQWCILFDEIGFLLPDKSNGLDESLAEVLQVLNTIPHVPVMADTADKGRTPVRAELVLATTNVCDLNAPAYFNNAAAVMRRWNMVIDLVPKKEYASPDGQILLADKVPQLEEGQFPDYWDIVVKRARPGRNDVKDLKRPLKFDINSDYRMKQTILWEQMGRFTNIYSFLKFFNKCVNDHKSSQGKVNRCTDIMKGITLCELCKMPEKACVCTDVVCAKCNSPVTMCECKMLCATCRNELDSCSCVPTVNYQSLVSDAKVYTVRITNWLMKFLVRKALSIYFRVRPIRQCVNQVVGDEIMHQVATDMYDLDKWKIVMHAAGERAYRELKKPKYLIALGGAALLAGVWWRKAKATSKTLNWVDLMSPQVLSSEDITKRSFDQENVWYKNDYATTSLEVGNMSTSWKGKDHAWIMKSVETNLVTLRVKHNDGKTHSVRAFCVADKLYAVNSHCIPAPETAPFMVDVIRSPDVGKGVSSNVYDLPVYKEHIYNKVALGCDRNDVTFLWLDCLPARKNLLQLLPSESLRGIHKGYYVYRGDDGVVKPGHRVDALTYSLLPMPKMGIMGMFNGVCESYTVPGDCGSMFISETPMGPLILGIHSMGDDLKRTQQVMISPVWREYAKEALDKFTPVITHSGTIRVEHPDMNLNVADLHQKSPVRFIEEGVADVYGTLTGPRSHPKSRVKPTLIANYLKDRGYSTTHGKPVMNGWEPKHNALVNMLKPHCYLEPAILKEATAGFIADILEGLDDEARESLGVVDLDVAINGVAEVAHLDRINISTSTGYPYKCPKKKKLIPVDPIKGLEGKLELDADLLQEVLDIIAAYKRGERYNPVNSANLKDEPLKRAKIEAKRTRMFSGSPVAWVIVVRMYLLTMLRLVYTHHMLFESAPGMAANSSEWHDMIAQVATWPDRCLDGDFKDFDTTMKARIIVHVFEVFSAIAKWSGMYSEEDLQVIHLIGQDTAYPLFEFFGDVMMIFGMNPSGNPATVIINGFANCIYMRYVYISANAEHNVREFKDHVHLMTYGDDNWQSVSPDCTSYNHNVIQGELAKVNITYTAADKNPEAPDFKHFSECSFLKRNMVYQEDIGFHVGQLEETSINKMLLLCVESKSVCPEAQCIGQIRSALDEYFLYGKEVYEKKRKLLFGAALECGLRPYFDHSCFPTWEAQLQRFEDNSTKRTFK